MSDSFGVSLAIGILKTVVCLYDVITLPVYYFLDRPWIRRAVNRQVQAVKANPDDPYSSYVRRELPPPHYVLECNTINDVLRKVVETYTTRRCMAYREVFGEEEERQADGKVFQKLVLGDYVWFSYNEIDKRVDDIAKGLLAHGVKAGDIVMILAETRMEWFLTAHAVFRIGATIGTLYTTLGSDAIVHGLNQTQVSHLVTTFDFLPKLKQLVSKTPALKCIIYIEGHKKASTEGFTLELVPFSKLEEKGKNSPNVKFPVVQPDDHAVIMYTSGSTGVPKGVILTHKNVVATIKGFYAVAHFLKEKHVFMAYLPLAHVLELAAECFFLSIGIAIGYSSPHTMTDKSTAIKKGMKGDASILQPSVLAAVPLVMDRIRKAVTEEASSKGAFFRRFLEFAVEYKKFWTKKGFSTPIVNTIVCRKIQKLLGGKLEYIVTGSAPLSPETHDFIRSCLNATVIQGYGLTETAAGGTLMSFDDLSTGRVGPPLYGLRIKLCDWKEGNYFVTDKPYPRGEIVIGGDCVAAGYFKNETAESQEAFREEDGIRWFYTGDIGEIQHDGVVKIIDRKKDLVKLQFGEYISLGKVETELKSCKYVDNICIYGNSYQTYVVALVVPNVKAIEALAKELGKEGRSMAELCRDPQINQAVLKEIVEHGKRAKLHKTEIPTKVKLCVEEWSPDSGLVTAALKLRRRNIEDFYKKDINRMYGVVSGESEQSKST
ncbi:long chain fatty acid CoA ligase-like protein [Dinothrombium tinctorium]|uniref:long-chain-fatty-acid--CoA ligase n=1 Tax=Dinothrombium tinctorium TaxID=1965070 RepID=A0A443R7Y8_9ACAR|nr:long chain fatty acid CoA ligase-like protein [Dinothrombium tinctorium]